MTPVESAGRGSPLVSTPMRWLAATFVYAAALAVLAKAFAAFSHSAFALALSPTGMAGAVAILSVLLWLRLRTQERAVARELRIARTGTAAMRASVTRGRRYAPAWARPLETRLGMAAVFLADGERSDADDALAGGSPIMRGGRLEKLRAVVEADLERSSGGADLGPCIERLRAMPAIGNREADLYRVHVLVKALLEQGDVPGATDFIAELESAGDAEARVYRVWLRVWFDLDPPEAAPFSEGELRLAMLLARAHGADKLVEKLEKRVATIASGVQGG